LILVASLALCVSVSSFYPRLLSAESRGEHVQPARGQFKCCCGTKDGRCCGKACCQMPNPKGEKTPAAPSRSDDRSEPLGLSSGALDADGMQALAGYRCIAASDRVCIAHQTLVTLSIRLNT
jgi:hypothetical protein